jgi:hypothetical protein
MNNVKLMELFEEVLGKWVESELYCIQDSYAQDGNYSETDLKNDVDEYRRKFAEALEEK